MRTSDIAFSDLLLLVHVRHHWLDDVDVSDGSVRNYACKHLLQMSFTRVALAAISRTPPRLTDV